MTPILFGVLVYVLLQLAVGAWVSRKNANEDDYLLAGRRLGFPMIMMTVFATWFGAETCIGAAGAIYHEGLAGGRADPFGYALCILIMGGIFASLLWKLRITTIADVFRMHYGKTVERIAVLLMVPTSILWAAAQIRAFGQVLAASSDLSVSLTITVAAAVVIAYTVMGGLLADAVTDFIQGTVLIGGLLLVFVVISFKQGGAHPLTQAFDAGLMRLSTPGESIWERMEAWLIPMAGSLFAQELVSRILASRSVAVARYATLSAGGLYLLIGLLPVAMGLMGAVLLPGLEDPEQVLPLLAQKYLHPMLYMLFAGALISAILSTVDSALLAAGAVFSHNLVLPLLPRASVAFKLRSARVSVVVFGVIAYLLAQGAEGVYALVEEASAFGSAGLFVVIVFALTTRLGGSWSAAASMLGGVTAYVLGDKVFGVSCPFLLSLLLSLVLYLGGASMEGRRRSPVSATQPLSPAA